MKTIYILINILWVSIFLTSCEENEDLLKDTLACRKMDPQIIEPLNIQTLLIENSIPLILSANRVHKAKSALNIARGNLLPSINLGVIASTSIQPAFILNSVEFLLPFLLPMKWFEAKKAKYLMKAEENSFMITSLNQYASLLSLYFTIALDFQVRNFMVHDLLNTLEIEQMVGQAFDIGQIDVSDWNQARIQTLQARARLNQFQELLVQELAQFRYALTLCPEVVLDWQAFQFESSVVETLSLSQAVERAMESSPESLQIRNLITAARADKWSHFFSFFPNASIGNSITGAIPGESVSLAFDQLTSRGSVNVGFATFPTFKLSNQNIEELNIRFGELKLETQKILDVARAQLDSMISRLEIQTQSAHLQRERLTSNVHRFKIGEISYSEVLRDQIFLRQLELERMRAQTDVDLVRLTLHRLLRTSTFAHIPSFSDFDEKRLREKLGLK